jgi:hypothetical protein
MDRLCYACFNNSNFGLNLLSGFYQIDFLHNPYFIHKAFITEKYKKRFFLIGICIAEPEAASIGICLEDALWSTL